MSLAERLHRLARRGVALKYAAPEVEEALRNYLLIHSRARRVPQLHQQALPALAGLPQDMLGQLFGGALGGDHASLAAYLDWLDDMGGHGPSPQWRGKDIYSLDDLEPHQQYLDVLHGIAHALGHQPNRIGRQYAQSALDSPATSAAVVRAYNATGEAGTPRTLVGSLLRRLPANHPAFAALLRAHQDANGFERPAATLPTLYDLIHTIRSSTPLNNRAEGAAVGARGHIAGLLRNTLIPHLEQG